MKLELQMNLKFKKIPKLQMYTKFKTPKISKETQITNECHLLKECQNLKETKITNEP
jgi:hypothetical protein